MVVSKSNSSVQPLEMHLEALQECEYGRNYCWGVTRTLREGSKNKRNFCIITKTGFLVLLALAKAVK